MVNGGWYLEVPGVKAEKRRDTRGPSVADVRQMLEATTGDDEGSTRDYAIVLTIYCLGLRVSELCGLTLQETDLARGTTWIKAKGRREKELVPLPEAVIAALKRYLRWRGQQTGPLFQTRGQRGKALDGCLETRSVLRIVRELGQRVGLHVWCHSLRHTSITQAAELGQKAAWGSTRSGRTRGIARSRPCFYTSTKTIASAPKRRSPISSPAPSPQKGQRCESPRRAPPRPVRPVARRVLEGCTDGPTAWNLTGTVRRPDSMALIAGDSVESQVLLVEKEACRRRRTEY